MQTCYNCGRQVADEVLICPDCGALVKRYTAPPAQEEPVQQPTQSLPRRHLYTDEHGRLRLTGGITAWLIVALCMAGYLAASLISSIYISQNEALFIEAFAAVPELQPLVKIISELAEAIRSIYGVFLALAVLLAAKFACGIWFFAGKTRLSHTILVVLTSVLAAILTIFGGGIYSIWMVADALVTGLVLRADRGNMR